MLRHDPLILGRDEAHLSRFAVTHLTPGRRSQIYMFKPIYHKTAIRPATTGPGFLFITLAFVCFGLSPASRAVTPPPDGGYPNNNTAEGTNALLNLTIGTDNTATGFNALSKNTTGGFNTATGSRALQSNTTGGENTA